MSDKRRCIHKLEDGKRCELEARPGGLFCEKHRTAIEGTRSTISLGTSVSSGVTGWFLRKIGPFHAPDK